MDQLIPIQKSPGGKDVVSARALHQFLQVGTRFDIWWARRVEEYLFAQNVDYQGPILNINEAADYVITLDMAKELSMVERNEQGRRARAYFIECEKKLRAVAESARPAMPTTYSEALRQLLAEVEQKEALEQELAIAAPRLAFVQAIETASNSLSFAKAAQWLKLPGVGRNNLINLLRRDGILQADRAPYQQYVEAGYFEVAPQIYKPGPAAEKGQKGTRLASSTRVTGKGLEWLARRYKLPPTLPQAA